MPVQKLDELAELSVLTFVEPQITDDLVAVIRVA